MRLLFSTDLLVAGATCAFALVVAASALVRHFGLLFLVMVIGGVAWITLMASFNLATQIAVPSWVRARALALYLLVFQGCMAVGSVLWGIVAEHAGIAVALWSAAGGLVVGLGMMVRYRLDTGEALDLRPSAPWPEPSLVVEPDPEDGPVLVMVEYRISPEHARDFKIAMQAVRRQRLRDGAFRSGLYCDPAEPNRYLLTFVVESWAEHLRLHDRATVSDRIAEERARAFHVGEASPTVSHYIYARVSEIPNDN
jgi:MFS family permease